MADITVNLEEEEKDLLSELPPAVTDTLQAGLDQVTEQLQEAPVELQQTAVEDTEEAQEFNLEELPPAEANLEDLPPAANLEDLPPAESADPAFGVPYERTSEELPTRSEFVSWGRIEKDVDPATLADNNDWVLASALMFRTTYGADVIGRKGNIEPHIMDILDDYGDKEDSLETKLANYGLEEMASFNWNIGSMGIDGANLAALGESEEDLESKMAFIYMLDQYENVNNSWKTTWNSTKALLTDPTNYAGLAAWGVGTVISQSARVVGKREAVKIIKAAVRKGVRASALKAGLNTQKKRLGAFAFTEGFIHTAAFTHMDQKVRLETEADYFQLDKEETHQYIDEHYSKLKTTGMGVFGGTVALGGSIILAKGIEKWAAKRAAKKLDAQQEAYEKEITEQLNEATQMLNDHQTTVITRMMEDDEPLENILEALAQMDMAKTVDNAADDVADDVFEEIVEEVDFVAPNLPRSLSGSKPTYNYGSFHINLNFEDDIAKALYIVGSKTKSKQYAQFMVFLQKAGVKNIQQRAAAMRNSIKKQAADGADSVDVTYNKPKTVKKTTKKATQKETVQAAEDVPYYHGSTKDFDEFEVGITGNRYDGLQQREVESQGVFFSKDYTEANAYGNFVWETRLNLENTLKHPKDFPIEQQAKVKEDMEYIFEPLMEGSDVKYINIFRNDGTLNKVKVEIDAEGKWIDQVFNEGRIDFNYADDPKLVSRMKERGYDSARVFELQSGTKESTMVFDPKKINKVKKRDAIRDPEPNADTRPKVDVGKVPNFMKKTVELLKMVKDNPEAAVNKVLQQLDKMSYRMVEISKVKSMVNEAKMVAQHQLLTAEAKLVNKTLTDEQRAVLVEEVIDLQKIADNMEEMTKHMNAYSGRDLQDIQNWILYKTKQGETLSKEAIAEAHLKYYNKKYAQIVSERAPEVERLLNTGKFDEAMALINKSEQSDEVQAALKGIEKYDPDQAAKLRNDPQANASLMDKTSEAAIASMFNMTTIQYNTIIPLLKTYTMPLLDTLAQNPLSLNAWRKTMYQYSVMNAYQTHAVNAWRIAQHLEHTTLTSDPARFYDGGVKNKGGFWAVWRIMTRMVAGSDGYLQELIASSYMSAKAFDEIVTEASEKGLKGEELKDAVNIDAIFNRMKEGYDYHLTEQKLKPIIERANNMKLKGEKKEAYILARLQDMGREGLKNLTDEGALDLVRSLLYKNKLKRVFKDSSGKAHWENQFKDSPLRHTAERYESATAAWEDLMKDHPFYRLLLTPFWRTPVRLVNEAIRLSPFLQQMHPTFMDDLAGVNGMARQARASSEAMVAHSWLMYVTVKYAQGEITGSGDVDFTKKMQNTNSGAGLPPHIIEWSEGNGMSYLRAEPIRLPTQLWIDTLENYRKRTVKQGMGGYGDEMDLQEEFMADMGVVLGATLTTVQDTQLLKGVTDIVKMGGDTFDTFRTEDDSTEGFEPLLKYWTKKAMMVVPAQPRKTVQAISAHEKTRAFDATDRFVQMLTPNHESIPREYDWRFKPMQMHDPMIAVWGFSTHDYYQGNGFTEEEKEIDQYFRMLEKNDIAHVSRNWFKSPSHFGNEDMRNLDIEYVSESGAVRTQHIYALVHEEAAKMNKNGAYTRKLLNIIRSNSPLGTPDGDLDSAKIAKLKSLMSDFRKKAMTKLLSNPRYAEAKKLVITTRNEKENDAMRN